MGHETRKRKSPMRGGIPCRSLFINVIIRREDAPAIFSSSSSSSFSPHLHRRHFGHRSHIAVIRFFSVVLITCLCRHSLVIVIYSLDKCDFPEESSRSTTTSTTTTTTTTTAAVTAKKLQGMILKTINRGLR